MNNTDERKGKSPRLEEYLMEKRDEIIFALSCQDYTEAQIGRMFRLPRSQIHRMLKRKPAGYSPKWVKAKKL